MMLKPNLKKLQRQAKRNLKMRDYKPNGEREVARRKRQLDQGRLRST